MTAHHGCTPSTCSSSVARRSHTNASTSWTAGKRPSGEHLGGPTRLRLHRRPRRRRVRLEVLPEKCDAAVDDVVSLFGAPSAVAVLVEDSHCLESRKSPSESPEPYWSNRRDEIPAAASALAACTNVRFGPVRSPRKPWQNITMLGPATSCTLGCSVCLGVVLRSATSPGRLNLMLPARDGEALDRWLPPGGGDGRRGRPIEAWGKGSETANGRPRVLARRRPSGHIEQKVTLVIAGIDTHKDTLAVAVVDDAGRLIAGGDIPNTERGFVQLVDMFDTHHGLRVGIEGSGNFGRAVAVHLVLRWLPDWPVAVVEVPTLMTSRERRGQLGKGKTDPVDALAIARITARERQLPPVRLTVGPAADLRALLDYREDLVRERGGLVNRAHSELGGLRPGYQQQIPILTTRARVRAALELISDDTSVRATLCRLLFFFIITIATETAELKRQITGLVAAADTTLTDLYGVGPLIAAQFIAEVVDIHRYPKP